MGKYRNKIIIITVIVLVLTGAFLMGGNSSRGVTDRLQPDASRGASAQETMLLIESTGADANKTLEENLDKEADLRAEETVSLDTDAPAKDRFQTDAIPDGKPAPVEPNDVVSLGDDAFTITLSIRCDSLLANMELLHKDKRELVPKEGMILAATDALAYEGENVFNLLQRETKRAGIHLEFMNTPIYNSVYIEGIHNLYEMDAGALSGWMYKVNGWFPNYGSSRYQVKPDDVIEWVYTCDLGKDQGELAFTDFQRDE